MFDLSDDERLLPLALDEASSSPGKNPRRKASNKAKKPKSKTDKSEGATFLEGVGILFLCGIIYYCYANYSRLAPPPNNTNYEVIKREDGIYTTNALAKKIVDIFYNLGALAASKLNIEKFSEELNSYLDHRFQSLSTLISNFKEQLKFHEDSRREQSYPQEFIIQSKIQLKKISKELDEFFYGEKYAEIQTKIGQEIVRLDRGKLWIAHRYKYFVGAAAMDPLLTKEGIFLHPNDEDKKTFLKKNEGNILDPDPEAVNLAVKVMADIADNINVRDMWRTELLTMSFRENGSLKSLDDKPYLKKVEGHIAEYEGAKKELAEYNKYLLLSLLLWYEKNYLSIMDIEFVSYTKIVLNAQTEFEGKVKLATAEVAQLSWRLENLQIYHTALVIE